MDVSWLVLVECVLGEFESDDDESGLDESVEEDLISGPEGGSLFGRIDHKHELLYNNIIYHPLLLIQINHQCYLVQPD